MSAKSYNRLTLLRKVPLEIVKYLKYHNEELWKLLTYPDGPMGEPDLTDDEKEDMICYPGQLSGGTTVNDNKQVYLQQYTSEAELFSKPQLRIEIVNVVPETYATSLVTVLFQCIVNNKEQLVSTEKSIADNRGLALAQNLIETLNGVKIEEDTSEMFFNEDIAPLDIIQKVSFGEQFSGYEVLLSLWVNN